MNEGMLVLQEVKVTDAMVVSCTIPETEYTNWTMGGVFNKTQRCQIITGGVHQAFESAIDGNTGNNPLAGDVSKWIPLGATMPWRMLDDSVGTQTSAAESWTVEYNMGTQVRTLVVIDADLTSLRVEMIDPVEGSVYDQTYYFADSPFEGDFDSYCFGAITFQTAALISDLPAYATAKLRITASNPGATASVGLLRIGTIVDLGGVEVDAEVQKLNFSIRTPDGFGGFKVTPRGKSKKATYTVWVDANKVDNTDKFLDDITDVPTVYIPTKLYLCTIVFGYLMDVSFRLKKVKKTEFTLTIQGLT